MERIRQSPIKRILILPALLTLLAIAGHTAAQEDNGIQIPPLAPTWPTPPPGMLLSTGAPNGADGAIAAKEPDGSRLMVVYNHRVTGPTNRDPYYTLFDGENWSTPAPVVTTPGTDSAHLALAYDSNNVAHLIWEEPNDGLYHKRYANGSWSASHLIAPTSLRLFGVSISALSPQVIDVAWAARASQFQNPDVYHSRSTNGGNSWSEAEVVAQSPATSRSPQLVHDANGNVHLVWQERTATGGDEIRYARGLPWTKPVVVSPDTLEKARRPSLVASGNALYMAFTNSTDVDAENADQWAYFTACNGNCTSPSSWSTPENVSGQPVRVNESAPFDLIADIAHYEGCTYIFYHGFIPAVSSNEVIWNVNSCDGWSAGGRDQVTGFDMRGIYPQVVVDGDDIHLVYEWVDGSDHQIYYMHGLLPQGPAPGEPGNPHLPFVARP